jgi:uncharacterized protein YwlG (UPF0340 family)
VTGQAQQRMDAEARSAGIEFAMKHADCCDECTERALLAEPKVAEATGIPLQEVECDCDAGPCGWVHYVRRP